jgi:riboflavin-specific deaminase-like protein
MPQPHITLISTMSLDGRQDDESPQVLSNRLEENRIMESRAKVDAILTSAERIMQEDLGFPLKDARGPEPTIVVVDKNLDVPPEASLFKNRNRKVIIVTSKRAPQGRLRRIQEVRPDLAVLEMGENAINLEDMIWDLHRAGIRNMLLEADDTLNMRMLNIGLVDEIYLMVAPMVLGQPAKDLFDAKLDRRIDLQLEGILQYGDHVVLHYNVVRPFRR